MPGPYYRETCSLCRGTWEREGRPERDDGGYGDPVGLPQSISVGPMRLSGLCGTCFHRVSVAAEVEVRRIRSEVKP